MNDRLLLMYAELISTSQTVIEHVHTMSPQMQLAVLPQMRQWQLDLIELALFDYGYLFYPGETNPANGPGLARRYFTGHYQDSDVSNPE